jgi:hypothetical protein
VALNKFHVDLASRVMTDIDTQSRESSEIKNLREGSGCDMPKV